MPFPEADISRGGTFAFIATLSSRLKVYSVNPIDQRLFWVPELGIFQLNADYRYSLGRAEVYLYTQLGINPVNMRSIVEFTEMLAREKRDRMDLHDLEIYVDKFRRVAQTEYLIDGLRSNIENEEQAETMRIKLEQMYNDGSLQKTIQVLTDYTKPKQLPVSQKAVDWLNAYYSEDVVSRHYMILRMIVEDKYKAKASREVIPLMLGRTFRKAVVGIIAMNDRVLEVDPNASVNMDPDTGQYLLQTSHFDAFKIRDPKSRLKYGRRQDIYFAMVRTKQQVVTSNDGNGKAAHERIKAKPAQAAPDLEVPEEQAPAMAAAASLVRTAGRSKKKGQAPAPAGDSVEGETPPLPAVQAEAEATKIVPMPGNPRYFYDPRHPNVIYDVGFLIEEAASDEAKKRGLVLK